jgi:tRNA(Ile2) C34 agmatinyltransferase TiaS
LHKVDGRAREKYRWIFVDKKVNIRVMVKIQAEVVNGKCPTCDEFTMLVGIDLHFFRCMNCGADLEQHINGKITYLPVITAPKDAKPFVKEWLDDGEKV